MNDPLRWTQRKSNLALVGAVWLMAAIVAPQAQASPPLELLGAPHQASSLSARSGPAGPGAAYFQPALLLESPAGVTGGVFALEQRPWIELMERPDGVEITDAIYDAREITDDGGTRRLTRRPLPTADLPRRRGQADPHQRGLYLSTGAAATIIEDRLAVGFFALLPAQPFQAQRPHFVDEREQYFSNSLHFTHLGDATEMSSIAAGVAVRATDWLDVGAGATMTSDGVTRARIFVPDAADQSTSFQNAEVEIINRFVPHAGLAVRPHRAWLVSATAHAPYRAEVVGESELQLWGYPYDDDDQALMQEFSFVYGYQPARFGAGARWESTGGPGDGLTVQGDLLYQRWSSYLDRQGDAPAKPFDDVLAATVGASVKAGAHGVGVDARFSPTPVPEQRGRTNYVDNHRLATSVGWTFDHQSDTREIAAGLGVQVHHLFSRTHRKSADVAHPVIDEFPLSQDARSGEEIDDSRGLRTNNPGYPGYSSGGWLFGVAAHITARF